MDVINKFSFLLKISKIFRWFFIHFSEHLKQDFEQENSATQHVWFAYNSMKKLLLVTAHNEEHTQECHKTQSWHDEKCMNILREHRNVCRSRVLSTFPLLLLAADKTLWNEINTEKSPSTLLLIKCSHWVPEVEEGKNNNRFLSTSKPSNIRFQFE